ncbi:MAG: hypothetical protein K9W44_07180 [Candidatus Lokiarchaeota archaeon]|nr:hypothetical protein [Candidatus Harpocratesius repetitus]
MPKSNPKHIKKKVVYQRSKALDQHSIPTRYWIMGVLALVIIASVVVLAITWDDITGQGTDDNDKPHTILRVVDGCWVTMAYRIYYDKNDDGVIDYTGLDAEVYDEKPIDAPYTVQVTSAHLILGWYRGLLGLTKDEDTYIQIEAFVDLDEDGRNDNSGEPPLGFTVGTLKYKALIIYTYILEIYAEEGFDPSTITYIPTTTFGPNLYINSQDFFVSSLKLKKCGIQ